jgi:4-hydroxy-2-oxoheptanedioate aldolase
MIESPESHFPGFRFAGARLSLRTKSSLRGKSMSHIAANFADRVRNGASAFAAWCGIPDPLVPEIMCREGFDCAVLDMQHGAIDYSVAMQGIANCALAGKPAIVRVPVGEFTTASRVLDGGAAGIIAPMVNSVADARQLAAFTKFPPMGERSWGPHKALALTGLAPLDYLAQANSFVLTIAMIETRAALGALDDILAVEGIDGVFVGPSDLSIALTNGATVNQLHPEVDKALDHIVARAKAHKKFASAFCADGKRAAEVATKGYQLMSIGTDNILLRAGSRVALDAAHSGTKAGQQGAY